ncbi:MAG: DapH/DapD/GlmU-related protein, partial [Rikenellaceae bacterium]
IIGEVYIGENSWIGANTVILKNTRIGANCVVAAGSVISGTYPDNSLIIQKREITVKKIMPRI